MKRLFIIHTETGKKLSIVYALRLLAIAVLLLPFASCNDSDEADNAWRDANTEAYKKITTNPEYKALKTETGPSGVYYKVIKTGEGTEHPLQTSTVKVLYKGSYYDGSVFDLGSSLNGVPSEFYLGGGATVRGFSFALQNMVVGDKWEVWIPDYLGYGETDYYSGYTLMMKGGTTLVFDVELVSITQFPK
ncbi:MAG: FKBP-type peptidyl-prolyl cis-trans isomerase [Dysgonamonadaceae bacterium]|jgi:FKBP-type peptidyl-prolyl cis-trans isomerase|nr:FKBP-type peptidyl-prolyl cis-trans isomerase [Dysgonamonadaceae bacterium]